MQTNSFLPVLSDFVKQVPLRNGTFYLNLKTFAINFAALATFLVIASILLLLLQLTDQNSIQNGNVPGRRQQTLNFQTEILRVSFLLLLKAEFPDGANAIKKVDAFPNAAFLGIALANDAGNNFLYVANFAQAKINVYDKNWVEVHTKPFADPSLPEGFASFFLVSFARMVSESLSKGFGA